MLFNHRHHCLPIYLTHKHNHKTTANPNPNPNSTTPRPKPNSLPLLAPPVNALATVLVELEYPFDIVSVVVGDAITLVLPDSVNENGLNAVERVVLEMVMPVVRA